MDAKVAARSDNYFKAEKNRMQRRIFIKNTLVTSTDILFFPSFAKDGFKRERQTV